MEKNISRIIWLYSAGALFVFVLSCLILQNLAFGVFFGIIILMFTVTLIVLIKKVAFLEKQNSINLERFTVSVEHVNHVLFDNVLEADITNDCLIGENAEKLTSMLKLPSKSSYSTTIDTISREIVHERYSEEYREILSVSNILETFESGSDTLEYECIERSDGTNYRWIRVHYCIYKSRVTNCVKIISYVKNIEKEKQAYDRLVEKATTDTMTGFLNKMSTKEIVTTILEKSANRSCTILMIDIDNFKKVNDTYGHSAGDDVIIAICDIIKKTFRDTSIIGRMGGDEFLVCLRGNLEQITVKQAVSQLLASVQNLCIEYDDYTIKDITVSVGIVDTFSNENFDQLYHYADAAMYKSKAKGKNQYHIYDYTN